MTAIRQPRLLDASLRERARLSPVKLTLFRQLFPLSVAELTLPADAPDIALRDLIELYDESGSVGIYRVKEVTEDAGRTRTVLLEHGLCTLRDAVIPAQGFMASVTDTLTRLLAAQSAPLWAVGVVEAPEDLTIAFATEYSNLLNAVEVLLEMLPDGYALAFDQSVTPWLMHLRKLSDVAGCEGRLSRNLQSVRCEADGSRLCTRVYPFGVEEEEGRISLIPYNGSDHVQSEAADTLGVISHTFNNDLIFDSVTLNTVALSYLARHADPEVTITVDALDLSHATGESFDTFRLGKLCRLCLPDLGLTLCERIISIHQDDVYGQPGQMTLTLSNRLRRQTEAAEIDMLVRQATASKLLGGTVTEVVSKNRAFGTYTSPIVHYFDIEDWAALLDVHIDFTPDLNIQVLKVSVDGNNPEESVWSSGSFNATSYLRQDELGQIAQGQHYVSFYPIGSDSCGVSSTVTMTVIEKSVT